MQKRSATWTISGFLLLGFLLACGGTATTTVKQKQETSLGGIALPLPEGNAKVYAYKYLGKGKFNGTTQSYSYTFSDIPFMVRRQKAIEIDGLHGDTLTDLKSIVVPADLGENVKGVAWLIKDLLEEEDKPGDASVGMDFLSARNNKQTYGTALADAQVMKVGQQNVSMVVLYADEPGMVQQIRIGCSHCLLLAVTLIKADTLPVAAAPSNKAEPPREVSPPDLSMISAYRYLQIAGFYDVGVEGKASGLTPEQYTTILLPMSLTGISQPAYGVAVFYTGEDPAPVKVKLIFAGTEAAVEADSTTSSAKGVVIAKTKLSEDKLPQLLQLEVEVGWGIDIQAVYVLFPKGGTQ